MSVFMAECPLIPHNIQRSAELKATETDAVALRRVDGALFRRITDFTGSANIQGHRQ
jgi:hypothetical protein